MAPVVCVVLLLMGSLSSLVVHRLIIDTEHQGRSMWARTQARALGHGGLMWALARMEDPRTLDEHCRAASPGPGRARFAEWAERSGARVSCDVREASEGAAEPGAWSCRCGDAAGAVMPATETAPAGGAALDTPGRIQWRFEPAGDHLRMVVSAQWTSRSGQPGDWREEALLRKDADSVWRLVVGSWWDDRP